MQGFKSFPDKITLHFGKGVTAVVGPNGSGKSNIADAVKWVLGEQSSKSLRGSKMEDVIFSGTKDRKAQGFAEVTLTLDNSDGALNSDAKEVSVTRRYFRSGDSAYLINSKNCRLKDVNELFMDTGLGRDGYSMVSQGRIEEMVSPKSENRRDMLEEAAGISAYRYRRAEATKRLDQAEENLVRLRDIVTELKSRVGPLEKQSVKAQQFLVFAGEKKDLEIGLWVNTLARSTDQIREQSNKICTAEAQYKAAGEELERLSGAIDAAADGTRDINIRMEKIRNGRTRLEEQAAELDSQVVMAESSIAHNKETADRIKKDIDAHSDADTDIDKEILIINEAVEKLTADIDAEKAKLEELSGKLAGLKKSDEEYSGEYNTINSELSEITMKLSQTEILISSSESSVSEIRSRTEALLKETEEKTAAAEELRKEISGKKAEFDKITEECGELSNMRAGYELKLRKAEEDADKAKKDSEDKKLLLLSKQSRLKFLQDTEKNMEGYQGSVKAVLRDFRRGTLTGIRDTFVNLIDVDEKYQTAIETALGNAVQDIVTDTEQDAKKAINMLKHTSAGRATFLPLDAIKGRVLEERGLDSVIGYIDLAWKLVRCDPEYEEIVKSLLGRIAVTEDLDTGLQLARKFRYRFKIVTLDGQVINAGGSMTGGSRINNSGFLARRTEIEKITEECGRLADSVSESMTALKDAAEKYAAQKAALEGIQGDFLNKSEEKMSVRSALDIAESKLSETERSLATLKEEQDNASKRIDYFTENTAVAAKEKERLLGEKAAREEKLAELTGGRDSLMRQREEINAEISDVNMKIVSYVKESEAKKEAAESLSKRKETLSERKEQLYDEIKQLGEKNKGLEEDAQKTREAAEALRQQAKDAESEARTLIEKREEFEKSASDARTSEKDKTDEREKIGGELIRLQEKKAYLEKELNDIEKKLFDEYSLTRREAEESAPEIESVTAAQKRLSELKHKIKALGNVNVGAIEEYKEVQSRYEFLSSQVNDVEKSKKELLEIIDDLTARMSEQFRDRFDAINNGFKETFTQLFSGGSAELILEDENDILECGIEIKAQPPGKNVKSLSLLSGGEKGLTAIALLFAILKVRPAPFCIFDEVEAALDDVNVLRYAQYVRNMTDHTQFILITHRRGTMEEADMLYGVTMQEHGVSKLLELKTAEMAAKLKLE